MRLTNVAHLRLPFGPLWTYRLEVGSPGAALPLSADQARHVGEGPRAGSWMALALRLPAPVQREVLSRAWHAVVERHGTLRTVALLDDDGVPSLHEVPVLGGAWVEHPVRAGQPMHVAVRHLLDEACSPEQTPSHRLSVIETMDGPVVLIASDHAHVDMWSFLVLLRDLLDAVQALREGRDPALGTAPSFGEHTVLQAERPAPSPEEAARWHGMLQECGGHFPVFPLPLGADSPVPERVEVRDVLDVVGNEALADAAAGQGVSSLALVVSVLAEVTGRLAGSPLRALFPVHTRLDPRWHDSVGWFIANSVLAPASACAADAAAAVREAVRLGRPRLDPVLSRYPDAGAVPGMFALSWLDLRRLPVAVDSRRVQAELVSARIRTDNVMVWFVSDGTGLHLRCRYPDTDTARASVGTWLDAVVAGVRERAVGPAVPPAGR